jgi:hypothetical protein
MNSLTGLPVQRDGLTEALWLSTTRSETYRSHIPALPNEATSELRMVSRRAGADADAATVIPNSPSR